MRNPREVVELFYSKLWAEHQLDFANEIFAHDGVSHQIRSGPELTLARNPEEMREHLASWFEAFPDIKPRVDRIIVEGDLVVSWVEFTGTHTRPWMGIPPTESIVTISLVVMHRVIGGRIVEDWVLTDALGFFQQLGVVAATDILMGAMRPLSAEAKAT